MFRTKSAKPGRATFTPRLEGLEDRRVLSSTVTAHGDIVIQVDPRYPNDTAVVSPVYKNGQLVSYEVQDFEPGTPSDPDTPGPVQFYNAAAVTGRIIFYGGPGNDKFDNQTSLKCTAFGGGGNDILKGGHSDDVLFGDGGNDQLFGREGNDSMFGGTGNDVMHAGQGNDYLSGGTDNDSLYGDQGLDTLAGGAGNDRLDGGKDGLADRLFGGTGADVFIAETYQVATPFRLVSRNRDYPQDFNAAEHDFIVAPQPVLAL